MVSSNGDERLDTLQSGSSSLPATLATVDGAGPIDEIQVQSATMATLGTMATIGTTDASDLSTETHATIGIDGAEARERGPKPSPLAEGARLGRFLILRKLGEGGMGVVFVGYDGQLDRRVALKLLRTRHADKRAITRLEREAQGLARLSHPNVVQIYEVGQHDGSMFIAMELVNGRTLGDWLAAEPRTWVDIIDILLQAGHGLAGAHAAKLVHRDFKPDNMMVADDGRVRVLDFGLVRGDSDSEEPISASSIVAAKLDHGLTMAGSLLGTPAYMAPEQIAGQIADPLSDQFSFCVSAFEAFYGKRPFAGATLGEIAKAIAAGQIRPAPRESKIPSRVHDAIVRGLAMDPKRRWPDMDSLLAELEASLAVRRWWIWAGAAFASLLAITAVVGLAWQLQQRDADLRALNGKLENKLVLLERMLSIQQGLQATALVERDAEADALRLAVLAVGPHAANGDAPIEAIHALEIVLADDAQIVTPTATITSGSPMLWDASFSPDATRVVTAGHEGVARIHDATTGEMLVELVGHTGVIKSAQFLPDGTRVATASYDHSVRLWDANTGKEIHEFEHAEAVVAMRISTDGKRLAAASHDGKTKLWDTDTLELVRSLTTFSPRPPNLAFDPSSVRLAATSVDNNVTIYDAADGSAHLVLSGHIEPISAMAYSPDGSQIATVSYDGSARLWDAQTSEALAILDQRPQRLHSLAFAPDGSTIVIGGEDRLARVHDLPSGRVLATLAGHQGWVTAVAFAPDAKQIITASPDATTRVWEPEHGKLLATGRGPEGNVHSLRQAADGSRVVTSNEDGRARVWDLDIDASVVKSEGHRRLITAIEFAPDGSQLLTASEDGTIKLWTPSTGALLATLDDHTAEVADAKYSPDGRTLATASWDDRVRIWDRWTGELVHTLPGHFNDVLVVAWSPDGARLASAGLDRSVMIWDPATGERLDTLVGFEDWIDALAYAPNGSQLAVGSADGIVRLFDTQSSRMIAKLEGHAQSNCPVWLTYGRDGQLATGSCDNHAIVWNAMAGPLAAYQYGRFQGHQNSIVALALAPDGARLATASTDHTANLWGVFGGDLISTLREHQGALTSIVFAPDGTRLATGSKAGEVAIFYVPTGDILFVLPQQHGAIGEVVFAPNSKLLAVSSEDRATVWDVESGNLKATLEDHIGLHREGGNGGLDWPIPAQQLLEIGCKRLARFEASYAEAAAICDPLQTE